MSERKVCIYRKDKVDTCFVANAKVQWLFSRAVKSASLVTQ